MHLGGKVLHIFAILFTIWVIALSIVNLYYFVKLRDATYTISRNATTWLIVLNAISIFVAVVLLVFAIIRFFSADWRSNECEDPTHKKMSMPFVKASGAPCAVKSPCAAMKSVPKCKYMPYDGSMFQTAIDKFKCYVDAMKGQREMHQQHINAINSELQEAKKEFNMSCSMLKPADDRTSMTVENSYGLNEGMGMGSGSGMGMRSSSMRSENAVSEFV